MAKQSCCYARCCLFFVQQIIHWSCYGFREIKIGTKRSRVKLTQHQPPVKRLRRNPGKPLRERCPLCERHLRPKISRACKMAAVVDNSIDEPDNFSYSCVGFLSVCTVYIHILYRHNPAHKFRVADNIVHVYYSVSWNLSLSNWSAVISMTDPGPACIASCSSHSLRNMEAHSWRMIYNSRPINPI